MASLSGEFNIQEFTDLGALMVGGRLYTYIQGTVTQKNAYTDIDGAIPHTYTADGLGGLYIALNARGELPAPLYLADGSYDIALKRLDGSTVWTRRADPNAQSATALQTLLAASTGTAILGFRRNAVGAAVASTLYKWLEAQTVSMFDFMTPAEIEDAISRTNALDVSAAAQSAINYCIANHKGLDIPYRMRIVTVNIDRPESTDYDEYFVISSRGGGGFYTTSAAPMFSSTIPFTTAPVTALIKFRGIYFESSNAAFAAYVLDDAKFLRTTFESCDFSKIKCLLSATAHTQSIYFTNCNMRRWQGTFFKSIGAASYNIAAHGCLLEAGGEGFKLTQAVGCSFVQHWSEGSTLAAAISINGSQGLTVSGCYFESNAVDLDFTNGSHLGVSITGNFFVATASAGGSHIYWGIAENCNSSGNYCNERLHSLSPSGASKVAINDYAAIALTDQPTFVCMPALTTEGGSLGIGTRTPQSRGHFHSAANTTLWITDDVLGQGYGGAVRGYGTGGVGGGLELGVLNAGAYLKALRVSEAGAISMPYQMGFNGKNGEAIQAAAAVATDLATALTLINNMRTRLINLGVYI